MVTLEPEIRSSASVTDYSSKDDGFKDGFKNDSSKNPKNSDLYDDYKNYSYIDRIGFNKYQLPDEFKTEIGFNINKIDLDLKLDCYLLSVTKVTENTMEFAFRLEDTEQFSSWKFGSQNSENLKRRLMEKLPTLLPEGVNIDYIRYKKGSYILLIGLSIISAFSDNPISTLNTLLSYYKTIMDKKGVKEFFDALDHEVVKLIAGVLETMKNWVNVLVLARVGMALPFLVGATVFLGPLGGLGMLAIILRIWGMGGGEDPEPALIE